MNTKEHIPLVSVIIYVYNSRDHIIETLDSVKSQTYPKIELIVTDDLSSDNTLDLVESWFKENQDKFISTKIIRTSFNTGIAGNNNRGLAAASGEWVKFLPGDDILFPDAVQSLVNGITNDEIGFVYSNAKLFRNHLDNVISVKGEYIEKPEKISLIKENKILAMSTLINKTILINLGGFDEKYPMIDDWPLWLKLAENDVGFSYVNAITAGYRKHDKNISKTGFSKRYLQSWFSFCEDHLIPKGIKNGFYSISYSRYVNKNIFDIQKNIENPYLLKASNILNFLKFSFIKDFFRFKITTLTEEKAQ
ncbi:MAG TPA: glycosyltransferase [Anditalea sp.]|nr:glycosyltransferase [Anditalea sp.]